MRLFYAFAITTVLATAAHAGPATPPEVTRLMPSIPDRAVLPKEALDAADAVAAQKKQLGYVDRGSEPTRAEFILSRIRERQVQVQTKSIKEAERGFFRLEGFDTTQAKTKVKPVPSFLVRDRSENFIIPTRDKTRRLFTDTEFGMVLIEEQIASMEFAAQPNLRIAGHDAALVTSKHGKRWTTTVAATDGRTLYLVEANSRLSGKAKERFVDWVRRLVENPA